MFGSGSEGRGRFVIICPDEKEARFLRFVGVSGNRLKGTVNGCGGSLLDIRLNLCVDGVNVVGRRRRRRRLLYVFFFQI